MFLWGFQFNPAVHQRALRRSEFFCAHACAAASPQWLGFATEDEQNETAFPFPSPPFVTSNYLTGEYETTIISAVSSKECDVFVRRGRTQAM